MAGLMLNMGYMNADMNANFANSPTNSYQASTNFLSSAVSNTVQGYAGISQHAMRTNYNLGPFVLSSNMVKELTNGMTTNIAGLFTLGTTNTLEALGDRTNDIWIINLPGPGEHKAYFDLRWSTFASRFGDVEAMRPTFRISVLILWYLVLIWWIFDDLKREVSETMNQRQVQGSHVSVLGCEVSGLVAAAYAVQITAVLGATVIVAFSAISGWVSGWLAGSGGSYLMTQFYVISSWPFWGTMTSWFPIVTMFLAYLAYLSYRYIIMWPMFLSVRALMFWLVV